MAERERDGVRECVREEIKEWTGLDERKRLAQRDRCCCCSVAHSSSEVRVGCPCGFLACLMLA